MHQACPPSDQGPTTQAEFPNSNVDRERYDKRYDNRTANCNARATQRPVFLSRAAGSTIYVYGNGFTVNAWVESPCLFNFMRI